MWLKERVVALGIWSLAFGYFAFYIPYSALAKALSKGLLPGMDGPITGFQLLPAVAIATTIALPIFITLGGGWQFVGRRKCLGLNLPVPRVQTFISGLATAVIIATTTLNYTFVGISIVFALLLMRGGVLIMSPFVDLFFGRRVHWYSVLALFLSLLAIGIAFSEKGGYALNVVAVVNIAGYLLGYAIRLQYMTRLAKSERKEENLRFFVEETMVACVALTLVPAVFALIGRGEQMLQLREGFTTFLTGPLAFPAFGIGVLYACLYMFGSRIYLDRRENTFCIPMNRCASLLSGVVATVLLYFLLDQSLPSTHQWVASCILISALVCLRAPQSKLRAKVLLFVCASNRNRSPMAQAFCNAEIARLREVSNGNDERLLHVRAVSAGLSAEAEGPMSRESTLLLKELGIDASDHKSQALNEKLIAEADRIVCMSPGHLDELLDRFPEAASKARLLDPEGAIGNTHGQQKRESMRIVEHIRVAVGRLVEQEVTLRPEPRC